MNKEFIVCGFYTVKTPYEKEIKGMTQTCEEFKIPYYIKGYESRGSWVKNCAIKSEFIFEMLQKFRDKNILYIDADGKIRKYPILFNDFQADIGVHYIKGKELISNTIFFNNIPRVHQLVRYWIEMQHLTPNEWDQKVLQRCIIHYKEQLGISVQDLPPVYSQIFDTMKDCGDPIIEHFQASRRFKQAINMGINVNIPTLVCGYRTRILDDGTFFLTTNSIEIEKVLCKDFVKLTNENRWYPKSTGSIPIDDLNQYFVNRNCYIVGKGPSLDKLTPTDFIDIDSPVICLNESIHKIEGLGLPNQLFVLQQDAWLKTTCKPSNPKTIMLLSYTCQHWYADIMNKFCFHPLEIGLNKRQLSVIYAIAIAKVCGAHKLSLFAFDAAMTKDTNYAKVIGYEPTKGGDPKRFLEHRSTILRHAVPVPLEFIPAALAVASSDK